MANPEITLLRNMPIFGGLKSETLQQILDHSPRCLKRADEYFFRESDPADSLYVLQSGSVIIEKNWKDQPVKIGQLETGDCFGEMSLIDLQPRSAAVVAETDCQAIQIALKLLHDLHQKDLEQYAIIMMNMGREVSRRLRTTSLNLFELEQRQ